MTEKTMIARIPFIGVLFAMLYCAIAIPVSAQAGATELTWTDPATGLMWTKSDNGSNVNWQQATDYCRNLQLAGHSGWRLPTIDELQGIYDPKTNVGDYYVKGNLKLSYWWHWSSSPGDGTGKAWAFMFTDGVRFSVVLDHVYTRALCVRRSGE